MGMFCPHCGFIISESDVKCGGCGRRLETSGPSLGGAAPSGPVAAEKPPAVEKQPEEEVEVVKPWAASVELGKREEDEESSTFRIKEIKVDKKIGIKNTFWRENLMKIIMLVLLSAVVVAILSPYFDKIKIQQSKDEEEFQQMVEKDLDSANPKLLLRRAEHYRNNREFDKALDDLNKAISLKPRYHEALFARGQFYLDVKKEVDTAILEFSKAIEIQPKNPKYIQERAKANEIKGDYGAAAVDYGNYIKLYPDVATGYLNRGRAYESVKKYDAAINDFTKAMKLETDSPVPKEALSRVLYDQAQAFKSKGDTKKAIDNLHRCLALNPGHSDAQIEVAGLYFKNAQRLLKQHKKGEAIYALDEAIKAKPDFAKAYPIRGKLYEGMGEKDKAIADYRKALELGNKDEEIAKALQKLYVEQAIGKEKEGEVEEALASYSKIIEMDPGNKSAILHRGMILYGKKDYPAAISDFEAVIKLDPTEKKAFKRLVDSYNNLAENARKNNNYQGMAENYAGLLKYDPGNKKAMLQHVIALNKLNDKEKAIKELDKYIDTYPKDIDGILQRAAIYEEDKDYKKALADVDAALAVSPNNARILMIKGNIFEATGEKEKAEETWKEVVKNAKEDSEEMNQAKAKLGQ